jgi:hypothetical protein
MVKRQDFRRTKDDDENESSISEFRFKKRFERIVSNIPDGALLDSCCSREIVPEPPEE